MVSEYMDYENYTNAQLYDIIEEIDDYNKIGDAFKELMKRLSDDELVKIIDDMTDYEAIPYALVELINRSSAKAFDMGMDILINDKGDHFLQACAWETCYDFDDIKTVTLMSQRKITMEWSLIETILLSMYNYQTDSFPPDLKKLIVDSYNNMSKEKKAEFSEMFEHFLEKY